jgi:hypothetical protein
MDHTVADWLRGLGVKGVLVSMAEKGLITERRCMMERCYSPKGPEHFDPQPHPPRRWSPSRDHHPMLKKDGGHRTSDNIRLAHILCNNLDYAWHNLPEEKRAAAEARWRNRYSKG